MQTPLEFQEYSSTYKKNQPNLTLNKNHKGTKCIMNY